MRKLYNNLSIENLAKTEWFNQFNENQQDEILKGLEDNLDVSIYAKPELDWEQMRELRWGLIDNLDVSIYAKKEYDKNQMGEIQLGLADNLDISIYTNPEYPWRIMRKIRKHLLKRSTLK